MSAENYYGRLAGLSEEAIIGTWLGVEGEALTALVEERIARYLELSGDGSSVPPALRAAVVYAAERVPVAVVSGAFRREIEPVLAGAELDRHIEVVVAADDVGRGKPDPDGYSARSSYSAESSFHTRWWPSRTPRPASPRPRPQACAASQCSALTRRSDFAEPTRSSRRSTSKSSGACSVRHRP